MNGQFDHGAWRSVADLERRARWLELQVVILAETVRTLVAGLGDGVTEPGGEHVQRDIQQARDLLRIAESMPHPERLP